MLLWYSLSPDEAEPLQQVIDSFTALHTGVSVKAQAFSTTAQLNEQFISAASAGLGPDLVLAPSSSMPSLLAAHAIAPIDDQLDASIIARFNPAILAALQIDGKTYGLPQSLDTMGLFVNRKLVETPATDLPALLEQANSGTNVLVPTNFVDAYWGVRAFGGRLFDDDGRSVLDQGGFANWLAWLRDARNAPGMIQDSNRDVLRQQFMAGNAGYYIGYASELNQILAALAPSPVEDYPLPSGPVGQAGPLVTSSAFFFSSVSSENQRRLAGELAKFVTNAEQSSRLMRLARQVPANATLRINPRLYPNVASFVAQARNGVPKPTNPQFDTATRLGNEAYVRTLEGGESPAEVAFSVSNSINAANGFEVQSAPSYTCSNLGTMRLLVNLPDGPALNTLNGIVEKFQESCPLIIVETVAASSPQIKNAMTAPSSRHGPVVVSLVDRRQLADLLGASPGVFNLNSFISTEVLQRFAPIAVNAMLLNNNLYGLPLMMNVDTLYYNRDMVQTPAQTLDDFRTQAASGIPIALDTNFMTAFWGMRAFGAQPFASSGASILDQGGMAEWLNWLKESRDSFGIQLSYNSEALREQFTQGKTAYYVGGPGELSLLREAMGDSLQVTLLPSGPGGPAQPLVTVEGLSLRADATKAGQGVALSFMRFVTDLPSQKALMDEANILPSNGSVSTADNPFFSVFVKEAQTGYLLPSLPQSLTLLELGPGAYMGVLDEGREAADVVNELTNAINQANGIVVTPTPLPTATSEPTAESTPTAGNDAGTDADVGRP